VASILSGMQFNTGTALLKEKYNFSGDIEVLIKERQKLVETEYRTHLKYIAGFENFYQQIITAGLKTCIATSSNDHLLQLAEDKLGLKKKFGKNIFKASDVGNASKPDPAIYLYAAKQMNTTPDKCLIIEDTPKGIMAAKNAGMFCVGITTTFKKDLLAHADLIVDSYKEIKLNRL
jgi:HAD superfamily hydrolase (TIGR01509 family)